MDSKNKARSTVTSGLSGRTMSALLAEMRMPVVLRAVFYAITISAALLAVVATTVGGAVGRLLMDMSWYALMLSLLAFMLMVLVNFLASQIDESEAGVDADGAGAGAGLGALSTRARASAPENSIF